MRLTAKQKGPVKFSFVWQGHFFHRARPLVAALEDLSESCSIERAGPVLAVEVEDV